MSFLSVNFIVFIAISFLLTWICKGIFRKLCLLGLSFYFLSIFGNPIHWIYMAFIIVFTYLIAFFIHKQKNERLILIGGITIVVLGLAYFKYAGFFNFKNVIMPLGLSFYTFKSISYIVDVYKKKMIPTSFINYAVYVSFFPIVSAGPINRAESFVSQLDEVKIFNYLEAKNGAVLCALGMFQKMVFANYLFNVIQSIQNVTPTLTGVYSVLYILLYSFYIYIDFDGYSNMAIGISNMLGFKIDRNFRTPYLASSIKEFWSRWHISLSSWLKDYIYIPLGGSRKGYTRKYINIFIVFLISGIWHGSTLVFVLWGIGHGLLNIIEDLITRKFFANKKSSNMVFKIIAILFNFVAVSCLWVFFNATSFEAAFEVFANIFKPMAFSLKTIGLTDREGIWLILILVITIFTDLLRNKINMIDWISKRSFVIRWSFYFALILITIIFGVYGPGYNVGDFVYVTF